MHKLLLLLATLLLLTTSQTCTLGTQCTKAKFDAAKTLIQNALKKIKEAQLSDTDNTFKTQYDNLVQGLKTELSSCLQYVPESSKGMNPGTGLIQSIKPVNQTEISHRCTVRKDQAPDEWSKDPCCNPDLRKKMCCRPKKRRIKKMIIDTFSSQVEACCGANAAAVKKYLKFWFRNVKSKEQQCDQRGDRQVNDAFRTVNEIKRCFTEVFEGGHCENDSDCDGDAKCLLHNNQCQAPPAGGNGAVKSVVRCMKRKLPSDVFGHMKRKMGLRANSTELDVDKMIASLITKEMCVDRRSGWKPAKGNTKLACEQEMICNDGNRTCGGTSGWFCGVGCGQDGLCMGNGMKMGIKTEAQCNATGYCTGGKQMNMTECEGEMFCTVPGANMTNCSSLWHCEGYPFKTDVCVVPGDFSGKDIKCPMGFKLNPKAELCFNDTMKPDMCKMTPKGRWERVPRTKEHCMKYTECIQKDGTKSMLNATECQMCHGKIRHMFRAVRGRMIKRRFVRDSKWMQKKMVPKNKWVTGVDQNKAFLFGLKSVGRKLRPLQASQIRCNIDPFIQLMKRLNCACNEKKDKCFEPEPLVCTEDFTVVKGGGNQTASCNEGSANVNGDHERNDQRSITTYVYNIITDASATKKRRLDSMSERYEMSILAATAVDVVDIEHNVIGSVRGSGISQTSAVSTTLCVDLSTELPNADATMYTQKAFCQRRTDGKYYFKTAVSSSTSTQYCADISDTNTYFPCDVKAGAKDETDKEVKSGASSMVVSAVGLVIVAIVSLFL